MAEGRGVTAKVRWISKYDEGGKSKWIHCTPLLGGDGRIGVWMVVIIDDEQGTNPPRRKLTSAMSSPSRPQTPARGRDPAARMRSKSLQNHLLGIANGVNGHGGSREESLRESHRSESPRTSLAVKV